MFDNYNRTKVSENLLGQKLQIWLSRPTLWLIEKPIINKKHLPPPEVVISAQECCLNAVKIFWKNFLKNK